MADPSSPSQPWKISVLAKSNVVSAELHLGSPRQDRLSKISNMFCRKSCLQQRRGACDVSLRIAALKQFYLKMKITAGRLKDFKFQMSQQQKKVTMCNFRSSHTQISCYPSTTQGHFFLQPATKPSFLSRLFSRRRKKGNTFAFGAGLGALGLIVINRLRTPYFPLLVVNAGSYIYNLLAKMLQSKENNASSKSAKVSQVMQKSGTILQMILSMGRGSIVCNRFTITAFVTVSAALILMGKLNNFQQRKGHSRSRSQSLLSRLFLRMMSVLRLFKRFWAQIGVKHAVVFVVLVGFISNLVSRFEKDF